MVRPRIAAILFYEREISILSGASYGPPTTMQVTVRTMPGTV